MAGTSGIAVWAEGIKADLQQRLPGQRKTQRDKLSLLVATMLHVRSANLVELGSGLPRRSDRWDLGYQGIARFLANDLVCCDAVMQPFAGEILARLAEAGDPVPLILDQSKVSERHQVLMLSLRWGERALPVAGRVVARRASTWGSRRASWVRRARGAARGFARAFSVGRMQHDLTPTAG